MGCSQCAERGEDGTREEIEVFNTSYLLENKSASENFTHCWNTGSLNPRFAGDLLRVQRYQHDGLRIPEVSHLEPQSISNWSLFRLTLFTLSPADANFLRISEVSSKSHPSIICCDPRRLVVDCGIAVSSIDLRHKDKPI